VPSLGFGAAFGAGLAPDLDADFGAGFKAAFEAGFEGDPGLGFAGLRRWGFRSWTMATP